MKIEPSSSNYDAIGLRLHRSILDARKRTKSRLIAAAGISAVGLASLAGLTLAPKDFRVAGAVCFAEADRSSTMVTVSGDGKSTALEQCGAVWRVGAIGPHADSPPIEGVYYDVPPLRECVRADGVSAVFPMEEVVGDGFCAGQGMKVPD